MRDGSLHKRTLNACKAESRTWGLYKATELHVPNAMVPPRPHETTFGVLFAQQATWHVSNKGGAMLEAVVSQ